jgi:SulP family sulfate permease
MSLRTFRQDWLSNVRNDVLAGTVVALALIPEAIAFSIIAGVDPRVGLYAASCIAITVAITGGRPAMISAATGAMALLMVTLVKDYGLQYLFLTTIVTGVLQVVVGLFKLGSLMRFVSRSVVTGFVNALAILIFLAQLPQLVDVPWTVYALVAAGLAIIYGFPRITKAVPSPLVAIVLITAFTLLTGTHVRTVGDMGALPASLPQFLWPDVPLNLHTLAIVLPYAIPMTVVGLLESLMTAAIVDEFTDTTGDRNRECVGQGLGNIVAGLFGGMAGCGMIGQTVINVKSGGRGRLSTFCAGVLLLAMVVFARDWVSRIPMAASCSSSSQSSRSCSGAAGRPASARMPSHSARGLAANAAANRSRTHGTFCGYSIAMGSPSRRGSANRSIRSRTSKAFMKKLGGRQARNSHCPSAQR